jgi:two-component system LytT family response regulator
MSKICAIIIDDEQAARDLLLYYLSKHPEIDVIAEASDGFKGIQVIQEYKPEVIFLDIQMPKLTGFEMLELIDTKPLIVFSTAYDQFAIKAFEMNAIDYLLKPFSKDRFNQTIQKIKEKLENKVSVNKNNNNLIKSIDESTEQINRIAVRTAQKIQVVAVEDVHYLEAADDYVMIHTKEGRYLKEKTMKYFEHHLDQNQFVRIHRSFILNLAEMQKIERYEKDSHVVILKNDHRLKVSASGYKLLREKLGF